MIEILYYTGAETKELTIEELKKIYPVKTGFVWIDMAAPTPEEALSILEDLFAFHPLTIDDCGIFIDHPKIDEYDDYLFIVFHSLYYHEKQRKISTWELDFFVGKNYVITNHLKPITFLPEVKILFKDRNKNLIKGNDFLVQYLLDNMVNSHFPVLQKLSKELDEAENEVLTATQHDTVSDIYKIKRNLSVIKKVLLPQIEVLSQIIKFENKYFSSDSILYFNDIINQLYKIKNVVVDYIDMTHSTLDAHLSISSYKMNNIIKRLTLIMTIFMPLTILAGMGGMSEWSMITGPEHWNIAYPLFLLGLVIVGLITYLILKLKKWV